jgi:hypothetical protein
MNRDPLGYYAWLGLTSDASPEEVKAAYRKRARRLHPDVHETGNADGFRRVSEAYHVLSDPLRRARYDRTALAPDLNVPETAAPIWDPPPAVTPTRHTGWRIATFALAICALGAIGIAVFRLDASIPDGPPEPDATGTLAQAAPNAEPDLPTAPKAAPQPVPPLAGDPTAYVLPEGGGAVLWGGAPGKQVVRLGTLPPFTAVHAEALVVNGLQAVTLADGHLAYLDAARLMPGDAHDARQARCAYVAGIPPENGEVLARGASGPDSLDIVNHEPTAAVVTLSVHGALAARVYVAPDATAHLDGLPAGPWSARPAFGTLWSRGCGRFVGDERTGSPSPLVQPGRPFVISPAA